MGRRAIRTGDLVVPRHQSVQLWRQAEGNLDSSDCVVQDCTLAMLLGTKAVEWTRGKTCVMALVYDSQHQKVGWCDLKRLKRVE